MVTSTVTALNKITLLLTLTGCYPFYSQINEFRVKKRDQYYNFISAGIVLIVQGSSVFFLYLAITDYDTYYPWKVQYSTDNTNQRFETILCVSVYSLMQILCVINFSQFINILNALLEIDFELKRKFRREINNNQIESFNSFVLIYIAGHLTLLLITYGNDASENKFHITSLSYIYQFAMSSAYVIFFTSLVKLTVARFKMINSLFQVVSGKPDEDLKSFFQVVEIYKMVEKTFGLIDDCNGLILLFYLAYVFYTLTNEIYTLAFLILSKNGDVWMYISSVTWILHQMWILWELSMNCGVMPFEASRTAQILARVYGKGKDYKNMIDKFLTKSIKQEIKFSAYGFFVIDNSTLFKIVSAVTTYLVILIQFKQLEESKNGESVN